MNYKRFLAMSIVAGTAFVAGCALTAVLAQRASYYWSAEQFSRIAAGFEKNAKRLAANGSNEEAQQYLIAQLRYRKAIADMDWENLVWPIDTPAAMALDVVQSRDRPMVSVREVFSDPMVALTYECALAELTARKEDFEQVAARHPGANAATCSALGKTFLSRLEQNPAK